MFWWKVEHQKTNTRATHDHGHGIQKPTPVAMFHRILSSHGSDDKVDVVTSVDKTDCCRAILVGNEFRECKCSQLTISATKSDNGHSCNESRIGAGSASYDTANEDGGVTEDDEPPSAKEIRIDPTDHEGDDSTQVVYSSDPYSLIDVAQLSRDRVLNGGKTWYRPVRHTIRHSE